MAKLDIVNVTVSVEDSIILRDINLTIKQNETHAIMGPNATGKSTLAKIIMGHPDYTIEAGDIKIDGESILDMTVDERARAGLFLGMQNPTEVPGVTNFDFIKAAVQAKMGKENHLSVGKFILRFEDTAKELKMGKGLSHRYLNVGFSGGEKKRNEILQMKLLDPKFAVLDEIDSGLDVDALKQIGEAVSSMKSPTLGLLVITHYQRLLDYIIPDFVHVMIDGTIVMTGGLDLIERIDREGYDWVKKDYQGK